MSSSSVVGKEQRVLRLCRRVRSVCIGLGVLGTVLCARAEVRLPRLLASHMVLQRDQPVHFWGWAEPGETVHISLGTDLAVGTANPAGEWSTYLPPRRAGGPFTITIEGTNRITLEDILIGDVWVASGQSNMQMPLKGFSPELPIQNSAREIEQANHPNIRFLIAQQDFSAWELSDLKAGAIWNVCSPATAGDLSAVAYFFAREITSREHVPIGIVDSTWGGTPVEAWTSLRAVANNPRLAPALIAQARSEEAEMHLERSNTYAAAAASREKETDKQRERFHSHSLGALYNAMIAPLTPLPVRGFLWYQGESNGGREAAGTYADIFAAMITDWRSAWNLGDLPFLFVQLPSWGKGDETGWPTLRDAQRHTLALAQTGMAVTLDLGDRENIHPPDKQDVGARLALVARGMAYGEAVEWSGPLFQSARPVNGGMLVHFTHSVGMRLTDASEFEVAGADGKFYKANAEVRGENVWVRSPDVPAPVEVRYAWQAFVPHSPLTNASGLPAAPFRGRE